MIKEKDYKTIQGWADVFSDNLTGKMGNVDDC